MKNWKRALAFVLALTLCAGLCPAADAEDAGGIEPLARIHNNGSPETVGSLEAFSDHWFSDDAVISEDLSDSPGLAYSLTISDATQFTQGLPAGYDPEALLQWGMDPGLGMELLHERGFTGKGTVIAYVDQPIPKHEQYRDLELYYTNNTDSDNSMHGPAVLSMLAGKDIGTAPESTVHFYGHASWYADQETHAQCLYQIIEKNKTLPAGEKITMVGFSDNIDDSEANAAAFREAVQACEDAGIMIWFCGEYGAASFLPMSDRNDPENLTWDSWVRPGSTPKLVYVPAGSRTSATAMGGAEYIYWSSGGLSWTMPYALGVYAIGLQIDPTLTQSELRELIVETAYENAAGMRIIDPVAFAAAVLDGVGRSAEAAELRQAQKAQKRYFYALIDTASMTEADLTAVAGHLASVTDATVLIADTSGYANAAEIYTALQADAAARGGTVTGVQIFGTPSMVPAFEIQYKVQMANEVDEGGTLLTDLFYGNLENNVSDIADGYNVLDHFAEEWDVDLIPQWPVARLPLSKGEFTAFFEKYDSFMTATGLERQTLVNFSNPIFASSQHTDDMGAFLNRMNREFGLLEADDYRLYGNQLGSYPVTTPVLGGFTAENLTVENQKETVEFIINSHGQRDNIDCCYFENGKEVRASLINSDTINQVLAANPYYLDCWTCNNGYGMADNLTTTALAGQCVGMFSATTIISNNGVNCDADLNQMQNSNFYWFYYNYLKALQEGSSRAQAFHSAQQAYAKALIADSANGIRPNANYQFNLYNLLAYENFGVIEPNAAAASLYNSAGYIAQAGQSVPKDPPSGGGGNVSRELPLTDGNPVGDPVNILADCNYSNELAEGSFTHYSMTVQKLDNGYYRLTHSFAAPAGLLTCFFSPPSGQVFSYYGPVTTGGQDTLTIDLSAEELLEAEFLTINHVRSDDDRFFVFLEAEEIMVDSPEVGDTGHVHMPVMEAGKAPTCTEDGYTGRSYCAECGVVLSEQSVLDAKGHQEEEIPGKDANCSANGLTDGKQCAVCGEITLEQERIPAKGHNWSDDVCTACGFENTGDLFEYDGITYRIAVGHRKGNGFSGQSFSNAIITEDEQSTFNCYLWLLEMEGYQEAPPEAYAAFHEQVQWDVVVRGTDEQDVPAEIGETILLEDGFHSYIPITVTGPCSASLYLEITYGGKFSTIYENQISIGLAKRLLLDENGVAVFEEPDADAYGMYFYYVNLGENAENVTMTAQLDGTVHGSIRQDSTTFYWHRWDGSVDSRAYDLEINERYARFVVFYFDEGPFSGSVTLTGGSCCKHTETTLPGKEATCTADGLTEGKKCSLCGEITVNQKTIPALGHDLVEETVNGVLQERCTRCEHVKIGAAAATVTDNTVTVTLAEVTEPTWSYVTIYDDLGRFVEIRIVEIIDGKAEVTFTDNRIDNLKVFFLGENKTPLLNALTF